MSDILRPVTVRYTAQDYIDCQRVFFRPTRLGLLTIGVVATALAGWMLYLYGLNWEGILAATVILAACPGAWFAYLPWKTRRAYAQKPLAQLSVDFTLLPDGIGVRSERGFATYIWSDFIAWRTGARATIVYLSPQQFLQFPARLSADGFSIAGLNEALAREVGPMRR